MRSRMTRVSALRRRAISSSAKVDAKLLKVESRAMALVSPCIGRLGRAGLPSPFVAHDQHRVGSPPPDGPGRQRFAVVSGYGNRPLTRGSAHRHLVEELARTWDVDLIAMPAEPSGARPRRAAAGGRPEKMAEAALRLGCSIAGALGGPASGAMVAAGGRGAAGGRPWSPVVYAGRRLAAGGSYVLDVGDPWVLTAS